MQRMEQAKRGRTGGGLRINRLLLLLGLVGMALGAASIAAVFWVYGRDKNLPDIQKLSDYKPKQVTAILDAKGQRIGEIFEERRTFVGCCHHRPPREPFPPESPVPREPPQAEY